MSQMSPVEFNLLQRIADLTYEYASLAAEADSLRSQNATLTERLEAVELESAATGEDAEVAK